MIFDSYAHTCTCTHDILGSFSSHYPLLSPPTPADPFFPASSSNPYVFFLKSLSLISIICMSLAKHYLLEHGQPTSDYTMKITPLPQQPLADNRSPGGDGVLISPSLICDGILKVFNRP